MRPALRDLLWWGAPGVALTAGSMLVALEGPSSSRIFNAMMAGIGVVLVWTVAVLVRLRYPQRPLGWLLFALALAYAVQPLVASPNSIWFTLARVARPAVEVILIWMVLSFPSGRLQNPMERALVVASVLSVLLLWLPGVMLSAQIPMAGPFVVCYPHCPRNELFLADWPQASRALLTSFRWLGCAILLATASVLFRRLRQATPLMRRTLAPVLWASIARSLTIALFLVNDAFALALIITFWAIPLAIAWGLLRGRLYVAKALQRLVTGLREQPGILPLRDVIASALDDPQLEVAYWIPDGQRWVDALGQDLGLPQPASATGRVARVLSDAQQQPVAALIHDVALLDEPVLLDAVASSMVGVLEGHRMQAQLRASQENTASALEARARIERDLHDGAQQRLIAVRMKLGVATRVLEHDGRRAKTMLTELDSDLHAALQELRALAHGIAPPILVERGLIDALQEVALRSAVPMRMQAQAMGRFSTEVESAVYFCCLEALQNAAKHAGPGASVQVRLWQDGVDLHFAIVDNGTGKQPDLNVNATLTAEGGSPNEPGHGLRNMRQRIGAVGGWLAVNAGATTRVSLGAGFAVEGSVPIAPPPSR